MRVTGITMAATVTVLAVGCGYGIKAATDYDRTVTFATYQNYSMLNGSSSGNPLFDQRVVADVKMALASKGWTEVPQGEGRAAVVVHIATKTKHTSPAFYDGWGGGWRWGLQGGPGGRTTDVRDYKAGTVVVDMFDADTRQAIWRGSSTDALSDNPSTNARATRHAIAKMFSHFPPASRGSAAPIDTGSPRIVFSPSPAVLIRIEGEPVYRDVEGTGLQRIVNTRSFIVREPSGTFYLKVRHGWMEAYGLTGDWTVAGAPPDGDGESLRRALSASAIDLLEVGEPTGPDLSASPVTGPVPTVYVSTVPTDLIVTDGPTRFVPLGGTALEYVENTTARVFKEPTDGELFVLASGRWYRSWTTDGPWQLTATSNLPSDLARIAGTTLERATSRPGSPW